MNFKGKVAVITGAAAGIGRATAIAFTDHGASVALLDLNQAGVEETAAMVRQTGAKALALRTDVGVEREVAEAFQRIAADLNQVDILINNAGVEL
jgi:NAD(P)-dependent dehydrogenase (short-subunit alcohol dehydrogenase family)